MNLLKIKGAKPRLITKYEHEASQEVSDLFEVIASIIKTKQRSEY